MDTESLKTFVHVMHSRAIGKTAERLHLTQSAVSRRIQTLESALDVKLFVPEGRGIRPTDTAHVVLPYAEKVIEAFDELQSSVAHAGNQRFKLRLAATPQSIETLIAPKVGVLRDAGFDLELHEAGGADVLEVVRTDICDCGITAHPTFETGLASKMLGDLRLHAFSATPFETPQIDILDLFSKDLIVLDSTYQSRRVLDGAFQLANKVPKVRYEGRSARAILALAKAGQGTAVLPSNIDSDLPQTEVTFQSESLKIPTSLVWRRRALTHKAIQSIGELLSV